MTMMVMVVITVMMMVVMVMVMMMVMMMMVMMMMMKMMMMMLMMVVVMMMMMMMMKHVNHCNMMKYICLNNVNGIDHEEFVLLGLENVINTEINSFLNFQSSPSLRACGKCLDKRRY